MATTDSKRIDLPTVIAIAAIAGLVANQLHEGAGHGGACLALGRPVREWGAFYLDCDTKSAPPAVGRLVAAAGSTMNLLTAIVAAAMKRATPATMPRARFFWWLLFAFSGFDWAGYYLFSGVSGIGDWGQDGVFAGVRGWALWRIALAVGGGLLYWAWAIVAMRRLATLTGADDVGRRHARLLCWTSYFALGCIAFVIGLMNPKGVYILLASAVASSFGGPSGLLWAPFYIRSGPAAAAPFGIARSWGWIGVAVVVIVAEGWILGPGLRFAA
jgi:hypothetical protein